MKKNEGDGKRGSGLDDEGAEVVVLNSLPMDSWSHEHIYNRYCKEELLDKLIKLHIICHIFNMIIKEEI